MYIERVIRNVVEFCDRLIITDHKSIDRTYEVCGLLADEFPTIELKRIDHYYQSALAIEKYHGTNTWVFGVDGDEIYDPQGLKVMRKSLLSGDYSKYWCVFGNVLNVVAFETDHSLIRARGYLAPPSRSVTKLYNFSIIEDWRNCSERLHGEDIVFKPGFDASLRLNLHEKISWELSDFRCLHMPFMKRSSKQKQGIATTRLNPDELMNINFEKNKMLQWVNRLRLGFSQVMRTDWKNRKYGRGPLVEKDVAVFFT